MKLEENRYIEFLFSPIFLLHKNIGKLSRNLKTYYLHHRSVNYCRRHGVNLPKNGKIQFSGPIHWSIGRGAKVSFGENFTSYSDSQFRCDDHTHSIFHIGAGATLKIGNNSGINNASISCYNSITIGDYVKIGTGSRIMDTNWHSINWWERMNPATDMTNGQTAPVTIGNHVWLGANVLVMKGVTIGDRSVVSAGSIVTKDIPAGEVWGGNPAKFLKKLKEQNETDK